MTDNKEKGLFDDDALYKQLNKMSGVEHFLTEMEEEIRTVIKENPTKPSMLASMGVWLNYINTIKGIIE